MRRFILLLATTMVAASVLASGVTLAVNEGSTNGPIFPPETNIAAIPEERRLKLLSLVDVLEPLSEEELKDLAERCTHISLQGGDDFYRPELHDGGLFLILEGRVRVHHTAPAGKETTLDLLGSGTVLWACSMELTSGQVVHAQAVGPSVLAVMGREDLEHLVLNKPKVGLKLMDLLAQRLGLSNERMAEVAYKDVLSRLASQILRLLESEGVVDRRGGYKLSTAYTHEELGTMIGAERVAVNRALRRLQGEGVVKLRKRRIHVSDPEALRRLAEQ
jgi:CRP/FNR family transcriptional regulator, cyclic AMP receptor protein